MIRHKVRRRAVMVRLTDEQIAILDQYDGTRSEAIRWLLGRGMAAQGRKREWNEASGE